jgi:hypothetical protein
LWAYGTAQTLEALRGELPSGVVLHAHGPGIGLVALDLSAGAQHLQSWSSGLAVDTVVLDQRGCLSPRVVALRGSAEQVRLFARAVAGHLSRWEHDCPRGALPDAEQAEVCRYRDSMLYAGDVLPAGKGGLGLQLELDSPLLLPPAARWLHLVRSDQPLLALSSLMGVATTIAVGGLSIDDTARELLGRARLTVPGRMQQPAFDGPVDLRGPPEGEIL